MKKNLLFFCFLTLLFLANAQTPIVFNGDSLTPYVGQQVMFNQTLYVCGRSGNSYGGNLYLSYERLRQAEEVAIQGTPAFDAAVAKNQKGIISAYCSGVWFDSIRTGSTITNLVATVQDHHYVRMSGMPQIDNNIRPTRRPDVGDARLIVCGANLQYYCPDWEGTYGANSDEEFALQHYKTVSAMLNIDADIYALTELQQGQTALQTLSQGMNDASVPGRYAYVFDYDTVVSNYIKVGFIYRTDKVRPALVLGHPYAPGANWVINQMSELRREEVQAFDEISTGERLIVCMNHFKSKSGGDTSNNYYNANRVENAEYLIHFLENEMNNNYYNDEDVLILGDLNCSTMEEPIRVLEAAGYENQLTRFCPNEYSYTYSNQVQYLDHALASPSMAQQITGVMPYHINADESYLLHYNYSTDSTMYRYSDHDPIIIGITLSSPDTIVACHDIHYFESMDSTFGTMLPINKGGSRYWYNYANYHCAYINGTDGANQDWLLFPTFNLSGLDSATVRFTHTIGYGASNTWPGYCKLMISTDFTGDVATASWAQLLIPNMPTNNWEWKDAEILLPASYQGASSVTLAFKYEITANSENPAWEVKNVGFSAKCHEDTTAVSDYTVVNESFTVIAQYGRILVNSPEIADIAIYDLMGREIRRGKDTQLSVTVPAGIYLVRCNQQVKKVMVR